MVSGITITEFAKRQGVSRAAVYKWLTVCPSVRPTKLAGISLLSPADCRRLIARPKKKMGRPKKVVDNAKPAA